MALGIADNGHFSAIGANGLPLGNALFGVVGALSVDIRLQFLQDAIHREGIKREDKVHAFQGCQYLCTICLRLQRATLALKSRDTGVAVDSQDQDIAQGFGTLQVSNMTCVNKIETTVGKNDFSAGGSNLGHEFSEIVDCFDL